MKTRRLVLYVFYLLVDFTAILLALLLSSMYSISPHVIPHAKFTLAHLELRNIYMLLCIVWFFSTQATQLYDNSRVKLFSIDVYALLKNIFVQGVCLVLLLFTIKEKALSRTFVIVYLTIVTVFILLGKIIIRLVLVLLRDKFHDVNRVVIVGANELGKNINKKLSNLALGYHMLGYVDDVPTEWTDKNILGGIANLSTILSEYSVNMVIIALTKANIELIEKIIEECQNLIVEVKIIPDVSTYYLRDFRYTYLDDIPVVSVGIDRLSEPYWRFMKRTLDIITTLVSTILLFSWFLPLLVLLQKIFNPGPLLYKSERWGKDGKPFWIYKIRTMQSLVIEAEKESQRIPTDKNDNRITKFGKFLRRTSLDELPQFYNVIKGEMSIVGPRPFDSKEAVLLKQILSHYMIRYYIRPGITGWAQINGYRGGTSDRALMQKRIEIDNWYMHNWSIGLDIQIILFSAIKLLKGDTNAY